jgi:hypothetical protein
MKVCDKELRIDGRFIRIARLAAEKYDYVEAPEKAVEELRRAPTRIDIFTFIQKLPETSPSFDYPTEWDNLAVVPVSTFDHWFTKQINGKTRNMIRRADKQGVTVREVPFDDELVKGISAIYNETPTRQGRAFWHYRKGLDAVRRENGTFLDRSVFIAAFFGGDIIGFAKVVSDEGRVQAGLMQIVAMIQHRDKSPANALIAQAVRSCADRGIGHLVYSNFAYGQKERDSLSDFKQHNGFQRVDIPRYYVPLTVLGRAALRAGFHHRLVDRIPESVMVHVRRFRSLRYGRPWPVAKESSNAPR